MKFPIFLLIGFLCFTLTSTAQTTFRHVTNATNTNAHITILDHPQLNGNANAILQVTADFKNVYNASNVGVWYNGSKWTIYNQDKKGMSNQGLQFNVMITTPGENNFIHVATADNIGKPHAYATTINHPKLNNNPSAMVLVTQNYGANNIYNTSEIAAWYTGQYWNIYNENQSKMPAGASFNVSIITPPTESSVHLTATSNIWGQVNSATETAYADPQKLLFITHNGNQSDWNPNPCGIYYPPGRTKWSILTGNGVAMPVRVRFNVVAVNVGEVTPQPNRTIATVYTDCGFAGQSYNLQVQQTATLSEFTFNPKDLGIPDNSISSIKLSKGYSATLYFANGGGSADILVNEDCFDLYKLTNIESIRVFKDARLKGYADMHTHPMSHLGFGKRLMHGVPDLGSLIPKGTRYKGFNLVEKECNTSDERATTIEQALGTCNATHGGWGAENDCGNYIRAIVISKAFDGDFVHNVSHDPFNGGNVHGDHRHEGIETSPSFMYWPHQTSVTHQQMWWEWLKRTYDGGLRVMVALTVNSELFAEIIDGDGPKDDKASADLQLDEIITFVGRHDDFMEIARTPADLRRIVGANKMAVLLGMEVDNIGNFHKPDVKCDEITVRAEIKRLHEKGVRYIFPIHLIDNKFGGAAVYEDLFNYVNRYSTGSLFSVEGSADATINFRLGNGLDGAGNLGVKAALNAASGISFPPAFDLFKCPVPTLGCWDKFKFVQGLLAPDSRYATYTRITQGHVNRTGLTSLGEFAIREMMKLGMVIDVDHMSAKAINRSLSIAESVNGGYPINMGHNGIRIGAGAERSASIEMVKRVSALGGMFGVGTADTNPSDFVKNYNVAWYVMGSRNTAIGTDVNGFEPLPKASPNLNSNDFYRGLEKCTTGNRTWDYTKEGVAHYGLMTEFLRDARLQQNGYEMMNSLMLSAEYFAQMWEKCERQRSQVR